MVRSRLPLPSLLGLFGALLMLCPELLMGDTGGLSDLPIDDRQLQSVLAFTVEQYNRDRDDSTTYYKLWNILRAQSQMTNRNKYCLTLEMVRTTCEKVVGTIFQYHGIQGCRHIVGRINKPTCFFKVMLGSSPYQMNLAMTACSTTATSPPNDFFCSG